VRIVDGAVQFQRAPEFAVIRPMAFHSKGGLHDRQVCPETEQLGLRLEIPDLRGAPALPERLRDSDAVMTPNLHFP
jgi:hypothetical protein